MRLALALLWGAGCVPATSPGTSGLIPPHREPYFRAPESNRGVERYSAWFGDVSGAVLYFGLSPFWTLWWESGGDSSVDLQQPGDHLIGRFDMEGERFLPPLRVRPAGPDSRSSVWDVLAHSNGRIYYTTYFEEIGSVRPDGSDLETFEWLGVGFNELAEGPRGRIYVTRYSNRPSRVSQQEFGSVVILTPEGKLEREFRFEQREGVFTAPKSVAVDPGTGEIWLNADVFSRDGDVSYATLRLSAEGEVLERSSAAPELHFVAFGRDGVGWFAEDRDGELWLRATRGGQEIASSRLGPRAALEFVQDIKPAGEGEAVLALWSARAFLASLTEDRLAVSEIRFERPPDCVPPRGRSLLYTAVRHRDSIYGTLFCGSTVLSARAPARATGPRSPPRARAPARAAGPRFPLAWLRK